MIIAILLNSCEEGCFTADQFDSYSVVVDSHPSNDGITDVSLLTDHAEWHETGLRSNGDEFIIRIRGEWTSWDRDSMTSSMLESLNVCNLCARKNDDTSKNCICLEGQNPEAYPNKVCESDGSVDNYSSQNNPTSCTCTKDPNEGWDSDPEFNLAYAENIKYSTLNYYEKDGTVKLADRQSICKYTQGAGLYIGLFGVNGVTTPTRVYHLYNHNKVCGIIVGPGEECVDDDGNDRSYYEFRSQNNRIFMRDDNLANDGTDTIPDDDAYHTTNEVVKFKIYDEEYNNNFGEYYIQILRGVGDSSDRSQVGILEYMVRLVEDAVLGEINSDDERVGGLLEFMYRAIAQDSGFMGFLRMSLIFYVLIYGMATLAGVAKIDKKELMSRALKICLIILFTSSNSWTAYEEIVVGFFLDGMNSVISMINSMSMQALDINTSSAILDAQLDRSSNVSSSTRFTYIDNTIINLMSEAVAAKALGLLLATPFGVLYIIVIYALILLFIGVMAYAATVYLINVLKIILALSLGPLFIVFTLFGQTAQMFKSWISFLAGRSLEIIILFMVLFNFVTIINITFMEMLSYEACMQSLDLVLFKIEYLKANVDRTLMEWLIFFFKIIGLCYITYLIMEKVGDLSGKLISVGGVSGGSGSSGFSLASKFVTGAAGVAANAAGHASKASALGAVGLSKVGAVAARQSGLSSLVSSAMRGAGRASGLSYARRALEQRLGMQLTNPREFLRNRKYNSLIKQAQRAADKQGLTGIKRDQAIRQKAMELFSNSMMSKDLADKKLGQKGEIFSNTLVGSSTETFLKALDKKLIEKPLMQAINKKAKELQSSGAGNPSGPKFGKEMQDELKKFASKWLDENTVTGSKKVDDIFKDNKSNFQRSNFEYDLHKKIHDHSRLGSKDAAKALANASPEQQKKYLDHLQDVKNQQQSKTNQLNEQRNKRMAPARWASKAAGAAYRGARSMTGEKYRPDLAARNFARNLENQKARNDGTVFAKYATSRYWGNKLNLTNRNDKTAAAAALLNRTLGKAANNYVGKPAYNSAVAAKNKAGSVLSSAKDSAKGLVERNTGYQFYQKPKTKAEEKFTPPSRDPIAKEGNARMDRKTALDNLKPDQASILRDKMASTSDDNRSKAFSRDHFKDRYVDDYDFKPGIQMDRSGQYKLEDRYKSRDDLDRESKAKDENYRARQAMQQQLRTQATKDLRSQLDLGSSTRGTHIVDDMKSKLANSSMLQGLTQSRQSFMAQNSDSLKSAVQGSDSPDQGSSAFEKAARLQYLNDRFKLGLDDVEKSLVNKFHQDVSSDIASLRGNISQNIDSGSALSRKQFDERMKDIDQIQKLRAAMFSDQSALIQASDDPALSASNQERLMSYNRSMDQFIDEKTREVEAAMRGTKGPDGEDVVASSRDQEREKNSRPDIDDSVERLTYNREQDIIEELAALTKDKASYEASMKEREQQFKDRREYERHKQDNFSIASYQTQSKEDLKNNGYLQRIQENLENGKEVSNKDVLSAIQKQQQNIVSDEHVELSGKKRNSTLMQEVTNYDELKKQLNIKTDLDLRTRFEERVQEQSDKLSESIQERLQEVTKETSAAQLDELRRDIKALSELKDASFEKMQKVDEDPSTQMLEVISSLQQDLDNDLIQIQEQLDQGFKVSAKKELSEEEAKAQELSQTEENAKIDQGVKSQYNERVEKVEKFEDLLEAKSQGQEIEIESEAKEKVLDPEEIEPVLTSELEEGDPLTPKPKEIDNDEPTLDDPEILDPQEEEDKKQKSNSESGLDNILGDSGGIGTIGGDGLDLDFNSSNPDVAQNQKGKDNTRIQSLKGDKKSLKFDISNKKNKIDNLKASITKDMTPQQKSDIESQIKDLEKDISVDEKKLQDVEVQINIQDNQQTQDNT